MIENVDYALSPSDNDVDHWNIRLMTGEFADTVFAFGAIGLKEDNLTFDFEIISSPYPDLKVSDTRLQSIAGEVLYSVMDNASEKQ